MQQTVSVNVWTIRLLRIALSGIFINAGISHVLYPEQVLQRIENAANSGFAIFFGDPYMLGILSGYTLLIGGVFFLLGIFTRYAAILLFLNLIPITITIQLGNGILHGPLWKNVALAGGLLFFIFNDFKSLRFINCFHSVKQK
jgi:putative oxidoreductase